MDTNQQLPHAGPPTDTSGIKRKRSASVETPSQVIGIAPPAKKTHTSTPNVNYLSRAYTDTLSLIDQRDSLRTTLDLLNDYVAVMERHESLASNLGAKPLGPMLMKRFERLFEERPRILKSNSKDNASINWLDVVEFAKHKPEQFNLEKQRDGVKVCQFYTKQCRVEISEEDFQLISSGMPQKLIPPQPIPEDEEKELATIEILEKSVANIATLAEQVQTRIRSFKQRLAGRKNAITNRRQQEMVSESLQQTPEVDSLNSPAHGFVAVNRQPATNGILTNGKPQAVTASPTVRAELEVLFANIREGIVEGSPPAITRPHVSNKKTKPTLGDDPNITAASPVAIPNTPQNLVNYQRPSQVDRYDDSGPFKAEMLSRMEQLNRGDRVLPPCDRCRRLHMDCLKNLTACQGCTRKHAKCSWKEVTDQELVENPRPQPKDINIAPVSVPVQSEGPPQPVRDEELLGEDDSDDDNAPVLPKIEPGETPTSYKEGSLPPLPSSRIDSSPARDSHVALQAQEDISARAREVLNQHLSEVPASTTMASGFAPVNRQQVQTETRLHDSPAQEMPGEMNRPMISHHPPSFIYTGRPEQLTANATNPLDSVQGNSNTTNTDHTNN